jgi:hypothetical protein
MSEESFAEGKLDEPLTDALDVLEKAQGHLLSFSKRDLNWLAKPALAA